MNLLLTLRAVLKILLKKREWKTLFQKGVDVSYGPNSTHCWNVLSKDVIIQSRQACLELSKDELDLVIISNICAFQTLPTLRKSHHAVQGSSEVLRCEYHLHGVRVCRTAFLFLHCISCFRYDRIVSHYKQTGKGGLQEKKSEKKKLTTICTCHNFPPLSSVQIIIIPACCLLCVL